MKRTFEFILLLCFLLFSGIAYSQNRGERVQSAKVAFLSERLQLTPQTAEKFWPIYHQYDEEIRTLLQEKRNKNDERSAEEILDQEQKALDIKRKYSALFLKVITDEQLGSLYHSEREFNRILLKRMKVMENRQQQKQQNREAQMYKKLQITPPPRPVQRTKPQESKQEMPNQNTKPQQSKPAMKSPNNN